MKLYTYINDELIEIDDVTICLESKEDLFRLEDFFKKYLKKMSMDSEFEHVHYKNFVEDDSSSDIVLFNKNK